MGINGIKNQNALSSETIGHLKKKNNNNYIILRMTRPHGLCNHVVNVMRGSMVYKASMQRELNALYKKK